MKHTSTFLAILLLLLLLFNNSCDKDFKDQAPSSLMEASDRDDAPGEGVTVLGQKLNNPYALTVVKQAYKNLYSQEIPGLLPTHLYVRFLPTTSQQLSLLDLEAREYWDFPLDYKITHLGASYHDPTVQAAAMTWLYTVVPYGFQFPQVQYEILEQIVQVPYETLLLKEAYRLTNNTYTEPDAFLVSPPSFNGNNGTLSFFILPGEDGGGGGNGETGECGCPFPDNVRKPSGCVTVWDNMLNTWDAVRHVEVITAKDDLGLFFAHSDETSDNGLFHIT